MLNCLPFKFENRVRDQIQELMCLLVFENVSALPVRDIAYCNQLFENQVPVINKGGFSLKQIVI